MNVQHPPATRFSNSPLKVWTGGIPSEPRQQRREVPATWESLSRAFEQATGWRLAWSPHRGELRAGRSADRRGWMRIEDLSTIRPPGIPAVSRIYCEHLIERFNRFLDELVSGTRTTHTAGPVERPESVYSPGHGASARRSRNENRTSTKRGPGVFLDRLCVVPLGEQSVRGGLDAQAGGAQTCVGADGHLLTGMYRVAGPADCLAAAATAVRATLLTAARLAGGSYAVRDQVRQSIEQLFRGDVQVASAVCSVDPIDGTVAVSSDDGFDVRLASEGSPTGGDRLPNCEGSGEATSHLPPRGSLIFSTWMGEALPAREAMMERWREHVVRLVVESSPEEIHTAWRDRLARLVPAIELPELAWAIVRR
jgi:hypothetical protein